MAAAHLLTATFHSVNLRSPVPHAGHQLGGTHRREALARKKKKKKGVEKTLFNKSCNGFWNRE